jgi:hypothetical protein
METVTIIASICFVGLLFIVYITDSDKSKGHRDHFQIAKRGCDAGSCTGLQCYEKDMMKLKDRYPNSSFIVVRGYPDETEIPKWYQSSSLEEEIHPLELFQSAYSLTYYYILDVPDKGTIILKTEHDIQPLIHLYTKKGSRELKTQRIDKGTFTVHLSNK